MTRLSRAASTIWTESWGVSFTLITRSIWVRSFVRSRSLPLVIRISCLMTSGVRVPSGNLTPAGVHQRSRSSCISTPPKGLNSCTKPMREYNCGKRADSLLDARHANQDHAQVTVIKDRAHLFQAVI